MSTAAPFPTPRRPAGGLGRLLALGTAAALTLLVAQSFFSTPSGALAPTAGPSVYVNTYVPRGSFTNSILWFGARQSVSAARATAYVEERRPAAIADLLHDTAARVGAPLERVTIAGHGKPGGVMLDRGSDALPEDQWLLATHTLLNWLEADVASAVTRDAVVVFESCDTSALVHGKPAAEAVAFRRAVAATFDIPPANVVLFRGPAKYAWGLDGWTPRTYPLEIVFEDDAPEAAA